MKAELKRAIPITKHGPHWSQREYVECAQRGIGFSAHGHGSVTLHFHYCFPVGVEPRCTTVVIGGDAPCRYVDHTFPIDSDWIKNCRAAMVTLSARSKP